MRIKTRYETKVVYNSFMLNVEKRLQMYISASLKFSLGLLVCLFLSILGDIWSILAFGIIFFLFQKKLAKAVSIVPLRSFWMISGIIFFLLYIKFSVELQTRTSCLQNSSDSLFGYCLYIIWTSIFIWEAYFYAFVYKKTHFTKNINVRK